MQSPKTAPQAKQTKPTKPTKPKRSRKQPKPKRPSKSRAAAPSAAPPGPAGAAPAGKPGWAPPTAADLDRIAFEALTRRILAGGLTWVQVDARWPVTRELLGDCDPGVVAALDDDALRRIMKTPNVLSSGQKLRAVIDNAQAFQELAAEFGSVHAWLASLRSLSWEERVLELSGRFKQVRERRAWRFLREIHEPVPETPPWLD